MPEQTGLRRCPLCGSEPRLIQPGLEGFLYQCVCNTVPMRVSTEFRGAEEEAAEVWNNSVSGVCLWKCCPNCGWSEADEQGFQQQLENLPPLPLWRRVLRRIAKGPVRLADCWYCIAFLVFFNALESTLAAAGISFVIPLHARLFLASFAVVPVIVCRFFWGLLADWHFRRSFEHDLERTEA